MAQPDTFYFLQNQRLQRIYACVGSPEYPNLTGTDSAVLIALAFFPPDHIKPAIDTLVRMTLFSRRTVCRALVQLVKSGLLIPMRKVARRTVEYRLAPVLLERVGSPLRDQLARKTVDAGSAKREVGSATTPTASATMALRKCHSGTTVVPPRHTEEIIKKEEIIRRDFSEDKDPEPPTTPEKALGDSRRSEALATQRVSISGKPTYTSPYGLAKTLGNVVPVTLPPDETDTPHMQPPVTDDDMRAFFAALELPGR